MSQVGGLNSDHQDRDRSCDERRVGVRASRTSSSSPLRIGLSRRSGELLRPPHPLLCPWSPSTPSAAIGNPRAGLPRHRCSPCPQKAPPRSTDASSRMSPPPTCRNGRTFLTLPLLPVASLAGSQRTVLHGTAAFRPTAHAVPCIPPHLRERFGRLLFKRVQHARACIRVRARTHVRARGATPLRCATHRSVVGPTSRSARHTSAGIFDSTSSLFEGAPIPAHLRCPCARMSTYSPLSCLCLAGSWRHRGAACPPPALLSHVGCVWSCDGPKRALTQNPALHLLVVSASGRVAASMLVFRPVQLSHVRVVR